MALRRSPKPGALTAATLRTPRSLLTTRVARASPSMSSAMMSRGAGVGDLAEDREQVLGARDLLLVDEDVGLVEVDFHVGGVGDEVGAEVALVELHALDEFDVGLEALALFDGDDAVLADLVHRLGDDLADLGVLVGASRCRPGRSPWSP
jgi:hypothetical protein